MLCRKTHFEASQAVFLSLSCYKELKLTIKLFTLYRSYTLRPSDPVAGHGFKSNTAVSLSLLPSFFAFLASLFSFAGHSVGFILEGNFFRKAFRILGLDERKGCRVVEQDFHGNFQVNVTWIFAYFFGVLH